MKKLLAAAVLVLVLTFSGCVDKAPAPAAPAPTPAPTLTPDPRDAVTELVLSGDDELASVVEYKNLEYVNADACKDYEALCALCRERPELAVEWHVPVSGRFVSSLDTEIDLAGCALSDIAQLENELSFLPKLQRVYLLDSGLEDLQCRALADDMPQIRFVWMLNFLDWNVRTDIRCFSTLRDPSWMRRLCDADLAPLFKYCKDLVALDLGHNQLCDLTPIGELSSLKYLILADNTSIKDISPLANLHELEYLELFMCYFIEDFTPLAQLENMKALNLCHISRLDNLSFAENMPELEMLWIMGNSIKKEEAAAYADAHPDAKVCTFTGTVSATDGGWRTGDMNVALRTAFSNWQHVIGMDSWDCVEYDIEITVP